MTTESKPADIHDDVQGKLPWYINGTLETSERQLVDQHLEDCAHCRNELRAQEAIRDAVVNDGATPMISVPSPDAVIASQPADRRGRRSLTKLIPLAAAVAAIAIATSMLLLERPDDASINQQYETLTSVGASNGIDLVLEIQFASGLTADAQRQALAALGASDIAATGRMNEYRFTLPGQPASLDHINSVAEDLEARPAVQSARVVALQLPIQ